LIKQSLIFRHLDFLALIFLKSLGFEFYLHVRKRRTKSRRAKKLKDFTLGCEDLRGVYGVPAGLNFFGKSLIKNLWAFRAGM